VKSHEQTRDLYLKELTSIEQRLRQANQEGGELEDLEAELKALEDEEAQLDM